jgi:ELWxxDGT repeat protein
MKHLLLLVVFGFVSFMSVAQTPKQISHFKGIDELSSYPSNFVEFNGLVYYLATDSEHGRNLWVTDGTTADTRFFLESEPDSPTYNKFISYVTDNALYFASNQNIWKIDRNNQAKKLNANKIDVPLFSLGFTKLGLKLFINTATYIDLSTDQVYTYQLPVVSPNSGNWHVVYATDFAILQHSLQKDSIRVISATDKSIKSYRIPTAKDFACLAFNYQNRRFLVLSDNNILEITANGLVPAGFYPKGATVFTQQTTQQLQIYIKDFQYNRFEKYDYDGRNFELKNQIYEIPNNNFSPFWQVKSLVYGFSLVPNTNYSYQILVLDTQKDSIYVHQSGQRYNFSPSRSKQFGNQVFLYSYDKTGVFDTQTGELRTMPYTEVIRYEAKNITIGNANISTTNEPNYELCSIEPTLKLIKKVDNRTTLLSLSLIEDGISDVGYLALNEANKGKSIYKLDAATNALTPVYNDPKQRFFLRKNSTATGGTQISEDYYVYGFGISPKYTAIYEYNYSTYPSQSWIYTVNKSANSVAVSKNNFSDRQMVGDFFYEFKGASILKIAANDSTNIFTIALPIKGNSYPYYFDGDRYFYTADSNSRNRNQLIVYSLTQGCTKITDSPVSHFFRWKNQLIVIQKNGEVYLIAIADNYKRYYLMTVSESKNGWLGYSFVGNGFLVYNNRDLWYSNGYCDGSKLIDSYNNDGYFAGFSPNSDKNTFTYIFSTYINNTARSNRYFYDGKSRVDVPTDLGTVIGYTSNYKYYTDYTGIASNTNRTFNLYRKNLKNQSVETISTVTIAWDYLGYSLAGTPKRNLLSFADKYYLIESNDTGDKLTAINYKNGYLNFLYDNSKQLLFSSGTKLITFDGIKIDSLPLNRSNYVWLYDPLETDNYLYLNEVKNTTNGLVISRLHRITKSDYSIKTIEIPYSLRYFKTSGDVQISFPIKIIGTKLYAVIDTPNEGAQIWEIDESGRRIKYPTAVPETFTPSDKCRAADEQQLIPSEEPTDAIVVFPNPTSSDLSVKLPKVSILGSFKVVLYDISGRVVVENVPFYEYGHLKEVYNLDLPNGLPSGQYFIRLTDSSANVVVFKFVKI